MTNAEFGIGSPMISTRRTILLQKHIVYTCTRPLSGVVPFFFSSTVPSRCRKPLDGYMDLQLSIRIEEMVCELQLNTEKVVFTHHSNRILFFHVVDFMNKCRI